MFFRLPGPELLQTGHRRPISDSGPSKINRRTHGPYVVWNVNVAPPLSLQPKTWWFPIVGQASYRGYFNEARAQRYAAPWEKKGWDVYVDGVEAYSTLGWFRDPLINTFIFEPEADLAELIFHELGHRRLFINGDTDFNEAFATEARKTICAVGHGYAASIESAL